MRIFNFNIGMSLELGFEECAGIGYSNFFSINMELKHVLGWILLNH